MLNFYNKSTCRVNPTLFMSKQGEFMSKQNFLESENIPKLLFKFAIPSIISLLVSTAYNITDQIFIGNVVGILGNAATNVSFPIVTFAFAFAQLVGVGTAANFNINMGAKKEKEAKTYIANGLILTSVLAILVFIFTFNFRKEILIFSGSSSNVLPYAMEYLSITCIGLPFIIFAITSSNLIRADGSPTYSMFVTIIGAILNVFLDWLFMFPLNLGIKGAALATITGQIFSFICSFAYFFRFKTVKLSINDFKIKFLYLLGIIKLGTANFINLIILMFVNILLNNLLKYHGTNSIYGPDIPIAISGIVSKVSSIIISISLGLAQGSQPILSYNMGAKNYARVKKTFITAISFATLFCIFVFFIFQTFPDHIIKIFGKGDELYFKFGRDYIKIFLFMVFSYGIQPIVINYFTAIGNFKNGVFLSIAKQGLILIPLMLVMSNLFGLRGILYAGPMSDFISSVLCLLLVYFNFKNLEKQI